MSEIEPEVVDAPEPQGTAPEALDEGVAPEPVNEPPELSWRDDPEFQAVLARQAQLEQRLAEYQQPQQQGDQIDLNEFLNPLSDTFGENLARFLADRDQHLAGMLDQRLAPLTEREQQSRVEQGLQAVQQLVSEHWNPDTDGQLTDEHHELINTLADRYLIEENQRYGVRVAANGTAQPGDPMGQLAAKAALLRATDAIRSINRNARTSGHQANVDGLAAVQALQGDVKPGAPGAHDVAPAPTTPKELMAKYFGEGAGALV